MIRRLGVRDFVLVTEADLVLEEGFGALTGETGAGKSILLDALGFAFGARADGSWVRLGAMRAEVTVECDWPTEPEAAELLAEWGVEREGEEGILIRRVVERGGRSRGWINGVTVTQGQLRALGEWLCDIHGQHAHHALLTPETQRRVLDRFAGALEEYEAVRAAWRNWQRAEEELAAAEGQVTEREKERERLRWWLEEWERVAFSVAEWQEWQIRHRALANAANTRAAAAAAQAALEEDSMGALAQVATAIRSLRAAAAFDPRFSKPLELLASAEAEMADAVAAIRRALTAIEEDPNALTILEERIAAVVALARKHRTTPEQLPDWARAWQERLAALEASVDLAGLQTAVAKARLHYEATARLLSAKRRAGAERLAAAVMELLPQLALPHGRFAVALIPTAGGSSGMESVQFQFAANPGMELAPLAAVASGGELARVGLAIQVASAGAEGVPTMVFDEVDVGVGGAVAAAIGQLMRRLGEGRQVLAVTHQPQVAASAHWQWRVVKRVVEEEVQTVVEPLTPAERVEELARMVAGAVVTDSARAHAEALLRTAAGEGEEHSKRGGEEKALGRGENYEGEESGSRR
ncbi:MAG: DNA repair protein RecN [Hydrogenophilus sp.]|nr:DNA repair protein RecN [Hydrogenophilus sp.]